MFPPNLRDTRARNGIASELPSPAEGSALLAEEHISYQQSKVQDHRITGSPTGRRRVPFLPLARIRERF